LRAWAGIAVVVLALQVALGGLLSASYAATSCGSLAECMAASADVPWSALEPWREPVLALAPPINPSGALVQTAHRLSALVVMLVVLPLGLVALGTGRRRQGALVLALLAAALALGLRLADVPSLLAALAHNVVAAALLAAVSDLTRGAAQGGAVEARRAGALAQSRGP